MGQTRIITVLGIFILIMLTVVYVSTDSIYATHPIKKQISADPEYWLTINAKPINATAIVISGHVPRGIMDPVELVVKTPHSKHVTREQATVDSNFNYMIEIKTNPESWDVSGLYIITAYQNTSDLPFFVTARIQVIGGLVADFLDYQIDGGLVSDIRAEPNSNSLIITIDTKIYDDTSKALDRIKKGGVLTIELPRNVIEAKIVDSFMDDKFVVLVDGEDTPYEETTGLSVRTLTLSFPHGSNEIKIIGTSLDPEFSIFGILLAPLVLGVSIIVIVVLYKKGKFNKLYSK